MADEDDGLDDYEPENSIFRWMSGFVVLLAVAGFFGLAWYAYKNGGEAVDEKDVELIKADATPIKEAPANPGGMQIPNQDKTVYGLISGKQQKTAVVERILPAPEEPIARTGDTETWMNSSMKNKPQGDGDDTAKPAEPAPDAESGAKPAAKEQFNPGKIRTSQTAPQPSAPAAPTAKSAETKMASAQPQPAPPVTTPAAPAPVAKPAPAPEAKTPPAPAKETKTAVADSDDSDDEESADTKPAAKPKAESKPAASTPPAGTRVQLGAYKSQGEAESNWSKISHRFSDDLSSKQHYVVKADLGSRGVYYRLQVAPFSSSKEAEEFCLDFVSSGQGCILARGK